jgi:hypothetical protein
LVAYKARKLVANMGADKGAQARHLPTPPIAFVKKKSKLEKDIYKR